MRRKAYHVVIPAIMPVAFFLIVATPVDALGCFTRGLLAFAVALASGLAGVGTAIMGVRGQTRGDAHAAWWVISTVILTIPVVALLILA